MGAVDIGALVVFALITSFTPGPNNIASASVGVLHGYRHALRLIGGIVVGFCGIMLVSSLVSASLFALFPWLEPVMRVAGASYILWLAYKTVRSSYEFDGGDGDDERSPALGFGSGMLLTSLNPKAWFYGLTLFSTFLAGIAGNVPLLLLAALFLSLVTFAATSTWALGGAAIKQMLRDVRVQRAVNIVLALLLVYTALAILGWL